ncbi:MAG: GtrA family protein [Acidimicrobiales bacterium]
MGDLDEKSATEPKGKFGANRGVIFRYLITSGINVVNHQLLLQIAVRWWGWSGGAANAFAAMTAVIPAYLLSRYWVWDVQGKPSLRDELIPFWVIAAIGLVASTAAAELADRTFDAKIMISVGSLAGYLLVWVLKFIVLDFLFKRSAAKLAQQAAATPEAG